jgi:murein L,D-transpeptidase YcbB/YkuD
MADNGLLPESQLATIAGGGRLRSDAAAAWNAMNGDVRRRWGRDLHANDSYRALGRQGDLARGVWSQWAAWERHRGGGPLAAKPGTSNHGWGTAVDVDKWSRWAIDQIGASYGWAKKWSDAPSEDWHLSWKAGIWHTDGRSEVLKKGSRGPSVTWLQTRLRVKGFTSIALDGIFGPATDAAVRTFQSRNNLSVDGIVGPATRGALAR